jgi:hypothetical protein
VPISRRAKETLKRKGELMENLAPRRLRGLDDLLVAPIHIPAPALDNAIDQSLDFGDISAIAGDGDIGGFQSHEFGAPDESMGIELDNPSRNGFPEDLDPIQESSMLPHPNDIPNVSAISFDPEERLEQDPGSSVTNNTAKAMQFIKDNIGTDSSFQSITKQVVFSDVV